MNEIELFTEEERKEVDEVGFPYTEICDLCGDNFYFLNLNDGDDFVEYNGKQFLCELCRRKK